MRLPLALAIGLSSAAPARADEVVVFAAASLKTALDRVAAAFTAETGHVVTPVYGGSNALAKQIIEGAPADIFLSAAVSWMDEVETEGLVVPGTRHDLFGNALVLVAHDPAETRAEIGPGFDLSERLGEGRLAMALVDAVPAGQYGKAALEHFGLWNDVSSRVVQAENVRAALQFVVSGEAAYGIVYQTDAVAEPAVTVIATFPAESHPPIVYPAALLLGSTDAADRAFLDLLRSPKAALAFTDEGFSLIE
jgi:molybdate transport system substrate-binding protein